MMQTTNVAMKWTPYGRSRIHPRKFTMWVACVSITMLFVAFTSAYVVRQAAGNWLEFRLPNVFFYSTAVILLSSALLHGSYLAFQQNKEWLYKMLLILGTLAGAGFVVMQYLGWQELNEAGVMLKGNVSGSFVYVISGVHAAHVVGGIAALLVALIHAFGLPFKPTPGRKLRFEITLIYWHFVDFLWIYLLVFFILQR